jgi:hypothetical protein
VLQQIGKTKISPAPRLAPASKHHFLHGLASSVEANREKRKREKSEEIRFLGIFFFLKSGPVHTGQAPWAERGWVKRIFLAVVR